MEERKKSNKNVSEKLDIKTGDKKYLWAQVTQRRA